MQGYRWLILIGSSELAFRSITLTCVREARAQMDLDPQSEITNLFLMDIS